MRYIRTKIELALKVEKPQSVNVVCRNDNVYGLLHLTMVSMLPISVGLQVSSTVCALLNPDVSISDSESGNSL